MVETKNMARALRRHHAVRLKARRSGYWGMNRVRSDAETATPRQKGMLLATPALCSCYACGNPRKWEGERTIAERRWGQVRLVELIAEGYSSETDGYVD